MTLIFDYLDEMQSDIVSLNTVELEQKYFNVCVQISGKDMAEQIKNINTTHYQELLGEAFTKAIKSSLDSETKAIYFEYDMDNNWKGTYYLCTEYYPLSEENDDWACEWEESIAGPCLLEFSNLYDNKGGFNNSLNIGVTLYLIARTVVVFREIATKFNINLPLCIAYHDQDPIMRIYEE
ncbi:hypothetical protein [Ectobacillus antri]|uniref:hypothetical protein n=1 Tax=Ectobacillus antri TaxID=2486280 RepID=UPI000F5A73C0|nr:hypothetical protein [Ectobacillus antri]